MNLTAEQITEQKRIFNGAFEVQPHRAYSSRTNAERAVEKKGFRHLRHFFAYTQDGRCFPIFTDPTAACQAGVHFHFNVVS